MALKPRLLKLCLLLGLLLPFCVHAQVNLTNGLVAYYPFNGNANDFGPNNLNPSAVTNITYVSDAVGNPNGAAYFNGTSSGITIPNAAALQIGTNQVTITCKVKPMGFYSGNCQGNVILWKGANFVNGNYGLLYSDQPGDNGNCNNFSPNSETFNGNIGGNNTNANVTSFLYTPPIAVNSWYCVAMVFDGSTQKLYVNGNLMYTVSMPLPLGTNADNVYIGWSNIPGFQYWLNGALDELRLYDRAINPAEVSALCNNSFYQPADTVINKYAAVLGKNNCDNSFNVDDATGFNTGDTVLMIQMKGAAIDSSNTAAFGNILNYNGAGNYEYNVVKAKYGNTLALKYKVVRQYEIPTGKVQFVRVPSFQNYTVAQKHSCLAWNGTKGGVFVMSATGTVTLNADIDVSGKGFLGGSANTLFRSANICNVTDYRMDVLVDLGSQKGEGIAAIGIDKSFGRGHLANGGGGGNSHNSGGGGGSNGNAGGNGGNQWAGCSGQTVQGIGGLALNYNITANKLFLGGGGGAGHANEMGNKDGGSGGGIIIINATAIAANGGNLLAQGSDAPECSSASTGCNNDGTGGGGGGGVVALKSLNYTGTINALVNGGKGANVMLTTIGIGATGPGGGGSGGVIWQSGTLASPAINPVTSGGGSGVIPQISNTPNGALAGSAGQSITGFQINFPAPIDSFRPNTILPNFTDSIVACFTRKFLNTSQGTPIGLSSYYWDAGAAGTSTLVSPTFTFSGYGTFPVKLIATDLNGCRDSITKNIVITQRRFANAGKDTATCLGVPVKINASGGTGYVWSPATGLSSTTTASTDANPVSTPADYIVTVTDSIGCTDTDTITIRLKAGIQVIATPEKDSNCNGKTVQLNATGMISYSWSPATGLNNSAIANPVATINGNQLYIVTGKDAHGCISYDSVDLYERASPRVDAISDGNDISCYNRAVQLYANGAAYYVWHPGIYCNDSTIPSPSVTPPATTRFTVIGTDKAGCTGTDTITVFNYSTSIANMPNAFTPNGDGLNDVIGPNIYCDFIFEKFEVFNRWGQSVFFTYTKNGTWDGRFKGELAPLGVYYWYVKGHNYKHEGILLKGDFTLIR